MIQSVDITDNLINNYSNKTLHIYIITSYYHNNKHQAHYMYMHTKHNILYIKARYIMT